MTIEASPLSPPTRAPKGPRWPWRRHIDRVVSLGRRGGRGYPVDEVTDMVTILAPNGKLRSVSAGAGRILGRDFAVTAPEGATLVHPYDLDVVRREIASLVGSPGRRRTFEFRALHADGTWRCLETVGVNLVDDRRVRAIVLHSHDVSDARDAADRVEHERLHDRLTGLPTRWLFGEHLQRAVLRAARLDSTLAVFGVDLDGLSLVNEQLGYDRGDQLLVRVGRDIEAVLRADDGAARPDAVVARFEASFFVLYEDVPDLVIAAAIAERLAEAVREIDIPEDGVQSVLASATVGVVLSSRDTVDAESLLVDATSAMHAGKSGGGDCVEFFDETIRSDALRRLGDLRQLETALAEGQLRVLYQPKVDATSGALRGVEALVRWEHPERGLVLPGDFIPLAEASGLIHHLGAWVLTEACRQRATWSALVGEPGSLLMCVNVSRIQFSPAFPDLVERILETTHVPTSSLCLEVTESAVMDDVDAAIATMRRLQALGVRIAIDDFGTGYSSLAQLKRLPLDELKIDQSFVDRLGRDAQDAAIVSAIVTMGHALGLSVIAEGVETAEQLDQLRSLGCELAQGFLFSPAVEASAIEDLLTGRASLAARVPGAGV